MCSELDFSVRIEISAQNGVGMRLDRFLTDALAGQCPGLSRMRLQHWIALGAVQCSDGRILHPKTRLRGNEHLWVVPQPREADNAWKAEPIPLSPVFEDDFVLVLSKPPGLVVHPAAGNWTGTLLNGLLFHRPGLSDLPRAGIVHRLDRDTSGLIVVAKTDYAIQHLSAQLAKRTMTRRYLTLVKGTAPESGIVDCPIGRDPISRIKMATTFPPKGRSARTFYKKIALGFGFLNNSKSPVSLLECRLESGRTHQIRVHMQHIGLPVLGDTLYGNKDPNLIDRQALHAWKLALIHPENLIHKEWTLEMPIDMRMACQKLDIDWESALNKVKKDIV